jgi:hypothetical protein
MGISWQLKRPDAGLTAPFCPLLADPSTGDDERQVKAFLLILPIRCLAVPALYSTNVQLLTLISSKATVWHDSFTENCTT